MQIVLVVCSSGNQYYGELQGKAYDSKLTVKSLESRIMELEDQVQEMDKYFSEKDTLIEKYKIEYKEGEYL